MAPERSRSSGKDRVALATGAGRRLDLASVERFGREKVGRLAQGECEFRCQLSVGPTRRASNTDLNNELLDDACMLAKALTDSRPVAWARRTTSPPWRPLSSSAMRVREWCHN